MGKKDQGGSVNKLTGTTYKTSQSYTTTSGGGGGGGGDGGLEGQEDGVARP